MHTFIQFLLKFYLETSKCLQPKMLDSSLCLCWLLHNQAYIKKIPQWINKYKINPINEQQWKHKKTQNKEESRKHEAYAWEKMK